MGAVGKPSSRKKKDSDLSDHPGQAFALASWLNRPKVKKG